jgi:peroxiredoxin
MTMVEVGDPAPDVEVLDDLGHRVRVSAMWAQGPAVLAFLRHYG